MKKILLFTIFSLEIFAKSFTLSLGIENPGEFQNKNYTSDSNPKIDVEYLHYFNKLGIGVSGGLNFLNVEKENYSLITNISVNGALKLIEMDSYYLYTQLNVGYPYSFVSTYHSDNQLQSLEPYFYHELKVGMVYNDFNINVGINTTYLVLKENNKTYDDSLTRLSINLGFLAF